MYHILYATIQNKPTIIQCFWLHQISTTRLLDIPTTVFPSALEQHYEQMQEPIEVSNTQKLGCIEELIFYVFKNFRK